jgi:hypothetical protein
MFHLLSALCSTHETLHTKNDETIDSVEFLQPYCVVAADALIEIGTAVISSVLSLDLNITPIYERKPLLFADKIN